MCSEKSVADSGCLWLYRFNLYLIMPVLVQGHWIIQKYLNSKIKKNMKNKIQAVVHLLNTGDRQTELTSGGRCEVSSSQHLWVHKAAAGLATSLTQETELGSKLNRPEDQVLSGNHSPKLTFNLICDKHWVYFSSFTMVMIKHASKLCSTCNSF